MRSHVSLLQDMKNGKDCRLIAAWVAVRRKG